MTKANLPLLPFPAEIDRRLFGPYVSGLVDGEGHFGLGFGGPGRHNGQKTPKAVFTVKLRADDLHVLRLVQSYFSGCGRFYYGKPTTKGHPRWSLEIHAIPDLVNVILPHFARYPLYAKKARDLVVWSEAVRLIHRVMSRPRRSLGYARGTIPRWRPEELAAFSRLNDAIKSSRRFDATTPAILPPPLPEEPSLFG